MIVVLDFGSQFSQVIARKVRELGVYSELHPYKITAGEIRISMRKESFFPAARTACLMKVPSVSTTAFLRWGFRFWESATGCSSMAVQLNGKVERAGKSEEGKVPVSIENETKLFQNTPKEQTVWMSHRDFVREVPEGFSADAKSPACPIAAMSDERRHFYGVQFHPEVDRTEYGNEVLKNFVFQICGCKGDWTAESFIETEVEKIRRTVGDKKVSAPSAAALTHRLLPPSCIKRSAIS